jgi:hypothetical protein
MVIAKTQNFKLSKTCTAYGDIMFKMSKSYVKTPRSVHVGFGVDKVALGQVLQSSPLSIIPPMAHILIHSSSIDAK